MYIGVYQVLTHPLNRLIIPLLTHLSNHTSLTTPYNRQVGVEFKKKGQTMEAGITAFTSKLQGEMESARQVR